MSKVSTIGGCGQNVTGVVWKKSSCGGIRSATVWIGLPPKSCTIGLKMIWYVDAAEQRARRDVVDPRVIVEARDAAGLVELEGAGHLRARRRVDDLDVREVDAARDSAARSRGSGSCCPAIVLGSIGGGAGSDGRRRRRDDERRAGDRIRERREQAPGVGQPQVAKQVVASFVIAGPPTIEDLGRGCRPAGPVIW